jgi:hypothetical protein
MQRKYDFFQKQVTKRASDTMTLKASHKAVVMFKGPRAVSFQRMRQSDLYVVKALPC